MSRHRRGKLIDSHEPEVQKGSIVSNKHSTLGAINKSIIRDPKNYEFIRASLIIIALNSIFFVRSILLGLIPSPSDLLSYWPLFSRTDVQIQNWLMSDVPTQFEPWFYFNSISIHNLQVPLWNPYSGAGVPHVANMQSLLFFPSAWPIYLFGMTGFTLLVYYFIKIYLTGIFTYYYLKSIKMSFYSSMLGAIAFMFVGFNVVWLYWPSSNVTFILPTSLYIIEKYIQDYKIKIYLLAQAAITALGIFAGHPETFFHVAVVSYLYFAFRLVIGKISRYEKFEIAKKYVLFTIMGVALGAVQLFPFLEYLFNSSAWATRISSLYMLDWHASILNLVPEFYGNPSIYYKNPYYVSFTNYNESVAGYVGISIVCLAIFALITNYKSSLVKFYLLLSIWAIGVIYGLPLIFSLTIYLPLFSNAANTRLLLILGFNAIVLGSIGLNEISEHIGREPERYILNRFLISILIVLLLLFGLDYTNQRFLNNEQAISTQNISIFFTCTLILATIIIVYILIAHVRNTKLKTIALTSLLILVFAETGIHGMLYEPVVQGKDFYPDVGINADNDLNRTVSNDMSFSAVRPNASLNDSLNDRAAYPVNTQMMYGIYDIRNYDALGIKYYTDLLSVFATGNHRMTELLGVDKRFLDFMGVRWILSSYNLSKYKDISTGNATKIFHIPSKVEQDFISNKVNLSEVQLLFHLPMNRKSDANITIELVETNPKKVVRSASVSAQMITTEQWYHFDFYPLIDSLNKKYTIRVNIDTKSTNDISLWGNNPSTIAQGKLYLNGSLTPGSLCLNTYDNEFNPFELIKIFPTYYLYQNKEAMPRAFVIHEAVFSDNDSDVLIGLTNSSFDWKKTVILSGKGSNIHFPSTDSKVRIYDYKPNDIKIQVMSPQPGFLVLTDTYYPGWNAYINGTKVDIFRANYAFRAIKIDPGNHYIEFKYEPISVYLGGIISLISLLIFLGILLSKSHLKNLLHSNERRRTTL